MQLSKDEWLQRCAARYQQRAGMEASEAMSCTEALLENLDSDLTESPEEAADEDMSYWTDDGE